MIRKVWHNEKIRYLVIGAYNTFFGYSTFAILWLLWGQTVHYIVLVIISHIISVINAFIGYRMLVFLKTGGLLADFIRFNTVYLGTFIFNLAALPVLIDGVKIHPLVAQAVVMSVTIIASYILHRRFSFKLS
jgi:putative flippase GtrA